MSHKEVTLEEFKSLGNNAKVLLVDVREPSELEESGTIPGSINIPLGKLEDALADNEQFKARYKREMPNQQTPLVFSCRSGRRSQAAVDIATKLGYTDVKHFPGGWLEWEKHIKG